MTGFRGSLPLSVGSLLGMNVRPIRREIVRTIYVDRTAPTLVVKDDATIARINTKLERMAQIGRVETPEDPDMFAEGALAYARFLAGNLDETSFLLNWAGITDEVPE